jgi:hypothetical protein
MTEQRKTSTAEERALVLIADAYAKELTGRVKHAKGVLGDELDEGDAKSVAYDLDGQKLPLGKIQRTQPAYGWKVTDPEALLIWAKRNRPDLVTTVDVLDEDAVEDLMGEVRKVNAAVDEDGELIEGITHGQHSAPYTKIVPDKRQLPETLRVLRQEGKLGDLVSRFLEIEA